MRLLSSQLRTPGPLVMGRTAPAPARSPAVEWPRWVNGKVVIERIPAERIPPGWQSVNIRVQQRIATCEEAECRMLLRGWTEIDVAGDRYGQEGAVSRDQAAQQFGYAGPAAVPPMVTYHQPGTPCPEIHKVAADVPPFYFVNGQPKTWNEFEDAIGGGIHRTQQLIKEGRY